MKPGKPQFHSGQDYPARAGIPIPAAANGTVVYSGFKDKSGNTVVVHNDLGGFSVYAHMQNDAPLAQLDQKLFQGDIVGHVGSTGARTTGNHLHYSVLPEWMLHHIARSNKGGPLGFKLDKEHTEYPAPIDQSLPYREQYLQYLDLTGASGSGNASPGTTSNPPLLGNSPTANTSQFGPASQPRQPPSASMRQADIPPTNPLPPRTAPSTIPWLPGDLPRNPRLPGALLPPNPQPPGAPPPDSGIPPRPQPGPQPPVARPQPPIGQPQNSGQSIWQYLLQNKPLSGNPPPSLSSFDAEGSRPRASIEQQRNQPPGTGVPLSHTGPGGVGSPSRVPTLAQQTKNGQLRDMEPAGGPDHVVAGEFSKNGVPPIGYLDGADQTGTFDPAASLVALPRPRPPQAPAASWPSGPVAPLLHFPQAGAAAPEHPDWHDAGDWPQQGLPSWTQTQPAPQPALPVENLTTRVLRMKGVPEADIGAAINDPAKMQDLLNQLFGRRSMIAPGDNSWGIDNRASQGGPADQPDQASTAGAAAPENYLPFGWAGLQALLR